MWGAERSYRNAKKKAAIRFSPIAAIKEDEENLTGKLDWRKSNAELSAVQLSPHRSGNPHKAGRKQHQAARFRRG
jgi:hypothetical protein